MRLPTTLGMIVGALLAVSTASSQARLDFGQLEPHVQVERALSPDEIHRYMVHLEAGQFLQVTVDQLGIDAVVRVLGPGGTELASADLPTAANGLERVSIIADNQGRHVLEISTFSDLTGPGNYVVTVQRLCAATNRDRTITLAEAAIRRGKKLYREDTEDASLAAWKLFERALGTFQEQQDYYGADLADVSLDRVLRYWHYERRPQMLRKLLGTRLRQLEFRLARKSHYTFFRSISRSRDQNAWPLARQSSTVLGRQALIGIDIARLHNKLKEPKEALRAVTAAMRALMADGGNVAIEYELLREQGIAQSYSDLFAASESLKAAEAKLEAYHLMAPHYRTIVWISDKLRYYSVYIDVLMRLYVEYGDRRHSEEALRLAEDIRAKRLLSVLTAGESDPNSGIDSSLQNALRERLGAIDKKLKARIEERVRLHTQVVDRERVSTIDSEIRELFGRKWADEQRITRETRRLKRAEGQQLAAVEEAQSLSADEIQRAVLDSESTLVEYVLGEERSWMWVVTIDSVQSFELPRRGVIEPLAREYYELLTSRRGNGDRKIHAQWDEKDLRTGRVLSNILLGPVTSLLDRKRLVVVADGVLNYLPFAALPVPVQSRRDIRENVELVPLVKEVEVVSLPSASTLAVVRRETAGREPAPRTIAVFADPVFDRDDSRTNQLKASTRATGLGTTAGSGSRDSRLERAAIDVGLASADGGFPRLPFTRQEARSITSQVSGEEALLAVDFRASLAAATSPDLAQYRIIHFATHGLLDSQRPELSGLVLSLVDGRGRPRSGFLGLLEIQRLKLPAELIVLSACQTALGRNEEGEGLIGITRGFMGAGAKSVIASLWQVDDVATAELMRRFYEGMLGGGLRPSEALREAQIAMSRHKRWSSPYYWAGFVMQGEWK